jgi:hypothetical protein
VAGALAGARTHRHAARVEARAPQPLLEGRAAKCGPQHRDPARAQRAEQHREPRRAVQAFVAAHGECLRPVVDVEQDRVVTLPGIAQVIEHIAHPHVDARIVERTAGERRQQIAVPVHDLGEQFHHGDARRRVDAVEQRAQREADAQSADQDLRPDARRTVHEGQFRHGLFGAARAARHQRLAAHPHHVLRALDVERERLAVGCRRRAEHLAAARAHAGDSASAR